MQELVEKQVRHNHAEEQEKLIQNVMGTLRMIFTNTGETGISTLSVALTVMRGTPSGRTTGRTLWVTMCIPSTKVVLTQWTTSFHAVLLATLPKEPRFFTKSGYRLKNGKQVNET
tara:strand:+ start:4697 stop:5041 length:345 start_codon:yes stop_codon:yes gene_type:complete